MKLIIELDVDDLTILPSHRLLTEDEVCTFQFKWMYGPHENLTHTGYEFSGKVTAMSLKAILDEEPVNLLQQ